MYVFIQFVSRGACFVDSICLFLGKMISTGAVVIDLLRTRVADYKLDDSLRL
jgi:hypothetical protein